MSYQIKNSINYRTNHKFKNQSKYSRLHFFNKENINFYIIISNYYNRLEFPLHEFTHAVQWEWMDC